MSDKVRVTLRVSEPKGAVGYGWWNSVPWVKMGVQPSRALTNPDLKDE